MKKVKGMISFFKKTWFLKKRRCLQSCTQLGVQFYVFMQFRHEFDTTRRPCLFLPAWVSCLILGGVRCNPPCCLASLN